MSRSFVINEQRWNVVVVDPYSPLLVDRMGRLTVATTDPIAKRVYISGELKGPFLIKVLRHELGHCAICSFGLLRDIHQMVYPENWLYAEEWICNFLADCGDLTYVAYDIAQTIK